MFRGWLVLVCAISPATFAADGFVEGYLKGLEESRSRNPEMGNYPRFELVHFSDEGATYLGCLNCSKLDSDSVCNNYGDYGSKFSATSIWNKFGDFGSKFDDRSPWNKFSSRAPIIVQMPDKLKRGRFTINRFGDQTDVPRAVQLLKLIAENDLSPDQAKELICAPP